MSPPLVESRQSHPPPMMSPPSVTSPPAASSTASSTGSNSVQMIERSVSPPPYNEPPLEPISLYKVRLQEILHTTRSRGPEYVSLNVDGGFTCSVVLCGQEFCTSKAYKNKKLGHYAVAYEALRWLEGSHNSKLRLYNEGRLSTCQLVESGGRMVLETRKRKRSFAGE